LLKGRSKGLYLEPAIIERGERKRKENGRAKGGDRKGIQPFGFVFWIEKGRGGVPALLW